MILKPISNKRGRKKETGQLTEICKRQEAFRERRWGTRMNTSWNASQNSTYRRPEEIHSYQQVLRLLQEGNRRYVSGQVLRQDVSADKRHRLAEKGQKPLAVVAACSDSRVPPELIFDQGLGDLFVVRTAGNVLDSVAMGSVEYGILQLHTPLLLILGHNHCGAVRATIEGGQVPGSIGAITERIRPSFKQIPTQGAVGRELYDQAENDNIEAVAAQAQTSPVVAELVQQGKLQVLGAKYCQETGRVTFFQPSS